MSRRKNKCVDKTPVEPKLFRRFQWVKSLILFILFAILLLMYYQASNPVRAGIGDDTPVADNGVSDVNNVVDDTSTAEEADASDNETDGTESDEAEPTALPPTAEPVNLTFGSFELGDMTASEESDGIIVPFNLAGQGQPASTIEIGYDDQVVGETMVGDDGEWTFQEDVVLNAGNYNFYVHMISEDGTELATDTFPVEIPELVMAEPPTFALAEGDSVANGLTFAGTAAPNSDVEIVVDGQVNDTVTADEDGNWIYVADLPAGEYEVGVRTTMADGTILDSPTETINVETPDIFTVAEADGNFTALLSAIEATGLANDVAGLDEITLFAPTDEAFSKLPDEVLVGLFANPEFLRSLLLRHVVVGTFASSGLEAGQELTTGAGTTLVLSTTTSAEGFNVNGIPISRVDIAGNNGVIHAIDAIILPEFDAPAPSINAEGVPVFEGDFLTVVGTGEAGTTIVLALNGGTFGTATVDDAGNWQIANNIEPGEYEIVAYALADNGLWQGVSETVRLIAK